MFNLRVASRFIRKSPWQSLAVFVTIIVGVGVQLLILILSGVLNVMILKQTTSYQSHISMTQNTATTYENLDTTLLTTLKDEIDTIDKVLIDVQLEGAILNHSPAHNTIPFYLYAIEQSEDIYHSFYGLDIEKHLKSGSVNENIDNQIMLDDFFAKKYNIKINDTINFLHIKESRTYLFTVVGTFDLGLYKANRAYAFVPMNYLTLNKEYKFNYNFQLKDPLSTKDTIKALKSKTEGFSIIDWKSINPEFHALNLAQNAVVGMIEVMIAIGVFAIVVSLLSFSFHQKFKQIGTLKAMGIKTKDVQSIFFLQTSLIGIIATFIGLFGGTLAMKIYSSYMVYGDGTPRFTYSLHWYYYVIAFALITITFLTATFIAVRKSKKLDIIELIKI